MPFRSVSGFLLTQVLVAILVLGILLIGVMKSVAWGFRSVASVTNKTELNALRDNVLRGIDCMATLGFTTIPSTPLSCSAYSTVELRRKNGEAIAPNGKIGPWTLAASCQNNEIIVKATRPGKEPLLGTPYNGQTAAQDLFNGTSEFCAEYFGGSPQCVIQDKTIPRSTVGKDSFSMASVTCAAGRVLTSVSIIPGCHGESWMAYPVPPNPLPADPNHQVPTTGFCAFVHARDYRHPSYPNNPEFDLEQTGWIEAKCLNNGQSLEGTCRAICCKGS